MAKLTNDERRRRVARRHHLDGGCADVDAAVRDLVAVHSSDPLTPHLALRARVRDFDTAHLDASLCERRQTWRIHAMRRTLFVIPTADVPTYLAATAAVARRERRRVERMIENAGVADPAALMRDLERDIGEALREHGELSSTAVREAVPGTALEVRTGSGKWSAAVPLSSRLLCVMAMDGSIVRTRPAGEWRSSQYSWALASDWFDRDLPEVDTADAEQHLLRRYLERFGPATLADMQWWTGWTKTQTARTLAALDTVEVDLDGAGRGFVLAGDLDPTAVDPSAAFLPGLDPTAMGWKDRDWYLGEHAGRLFDTNGNIGPTVWWDGRVVGGWAQDAGGVVVFELLEDVGSDAARAITDAADALTTWFAGTLAKPRFRTPLERDLASW